MAQAQQVIGREQVIIMQQQRCVGEHICFYALLLFMHLFKFVEAPSIKKSNIDCNLRLAQKQVVGRRNDPSAESRSRRRVGHHCAATEVRGRM